MLDPPVLGEDLGLQQDVEELLVEQLVPDPGVQRLEKEIARLNRIPLLIIDEVGYIPFDPEAANLMFSLISARYEKASVIITSNKPFSSWGEIFGNEVVAAAMIDRLVHHAEILGLKGDSWWLKGRDIGRATPRPS